MKFIFCVKKKGRWMMINLYGRKVEYDKKESNNKKKDSL